MGFWGRRKAVRESRKFSQGTYPCGWCERVFSSPRRAGRHVSRTARGAARQQRRLGNPDMAARIERQAEHYRSKLPVRRRIAPLRSSRPVRSR
jgi:hypothetical protein